MRFTLSKRSLQMVITSQISALVLWSRFSQHLKCQESTLVFYPSSLSEKVVGEGTLILYPHGKASSHRLIHQQCFLIC